MLFLIWNCREKSKMSIHCSSVIILRAVLFNDGSATYTCNYNYPFNKTTVCIYTYICTMCRIYVLNYNKIMKIIPFEEWSNNV